METARFRYPLPESAIAQTPAEPRDSARLLDSIRLSDHTFPDLPGLLREGDLVVVNNVRVRAARLRGVRRPTRGRVEALLLRRVDDLRWEALLRPSRRLRAGSRLSFGPLSAELLDDPEEGKATLSLEGPPGRDVEDLLGVVGEVPLPPYVRTPLADPDRYQTIFAKSPGAAAAPTAGLHFTTRVVEGIVGAGAELAEVELEVGLDTFRPIVTERLEEHTIHRERYRVPEETADAVARCRRRGGRVVAVGTTVVRALESSTCDDGTVRSGERETGLFVIPGHAFLAVDALVTNFHAPGSTLLVLLEAFMGPSWRRAYAHALARGYRFLSFGDAMWAERSTRRPRPSVFRGSSA